MIIDLAKVYRNNRVESIHYGIACLVNENGGIKSWGDSSFTCYTRSLIKPLQAKACLNLGLELEAEDLAIAMSSHDAQPAQLSALKNLMQKHHIEESHLACGSDFVKTGKLKSRLEHNCSGKHSALIATCMKNSWSIHDYFQENHEIQRAIAHECQKLLKSKEELKTAKDGCGIPTFYLSLEEMGMIFSNLIKDDSYSNIIETMNKFPELIGASNKIDSLIMKKYPGQFIAKVGAEGMLMVANLKTAETLILKIIDGSYRARPAVIISLMEALGWIEQDSFGADFSTYNSRKEQVGNIKANSFS